MNRKIYFAGSIRGGREDAALYHELIEWMKESDTVLTEHIGDLSLSLLERTPGSDRQIYRQDTAWIRECDLLIAECTHASLGVGYELAFAEQLGKPCYLFYRPQETSLSAMLNGDPYFSVIPYESREELFGALSEILDR